jgi:pilus assembly protein CpaE
MRNNQTLLVLSKNGDAADEIKAFMELHGEVSVRCVTSEEQFIALLNSSRPSMAMIVIENGTQQELSFLNRVKIEFPQIVRICCSLSPSADLILQTLRAGAHEFLKLPLNSDEFQVVWNRAKEIQSGLVQSVTKDKAQVHAIFSSKGGSGVSFLATNLALSLRKRTLLIDLDLQKGDLDLYLGVSPSFSIVDVVESLFRMDDSLLTTFLTKHEKGLTFLAAPKELSAAESINSDHIAEITSFVQDRFDNLVIDLGNTLDSRALVILDRADYILMAMTLDIPSIRSTQKTLALFEKLGYNKNRVKIVINRWKNQDEIDLQEVKKLLSSYSLHYINNDYPRASTSTNLGRPIIISEPSSQLSIDIKNLGAVLEPDLQENKQVQKSGLFKMLFRRPSGALVTAESK